MRTHHKPFIHVFKRLPAEIHVDEILYDFACLYAKMWPGLQPDASLHENALIMMALDVFESSGQACRKISDGKQVLRAVGKYFRDEDLVGGSSSPFEFVTRTKRSASIAPRRLRRIRIWRVSQLADAK